MKLDPKIKETAIIGHCFNSKELKEYIGQKCYFTDDLEAFSDLRAAIKGVLKAIGPDNENCYLVESKVNGSPADFYYGFCLPAEFVEAKEKEYRPFTLEEFIHAVGDVGDRVRYRPKSDHVAFRSVITEFRETSGFVGLGTLVISTERLLNEFEFYKDGVWIPFGVEE